MRKYVLSQEMANLQYTLGNYTILKLRTQASIYAHKVVCFLVSKNAPEPRIIATVKRFRVKLLGVRYDPTFSLK